MDINEITKEKIPFEIGQDLKELTDFCNFLENKNVKSFIEIGTHFGGTFYVWSKVSGKGGKKISVDAPEMYFVPKERTKERDDKLISFFDNVHMVNGDSHLESTYQKVKDILKEEKVDLLFIDGDHSYEGVKKDFEMYREFVKEDGHIAFHDIKDSKFHREAGCYVSNFWDELIGEKVEFIEDNFNCFGIGVIKKNSIVYIEGINNKNSLFIVGAWVDSERKEKMLKECISSIKKNYGTEILLVSHKAMDLDIIESVDYHIYDKKNPMIKLDHYNYNGFESNFYIWYEDYRFRTELHFPYRHDYAVWTSWRNSFHYAKFLKKENIFYLEYDNSINDKNFTEEFMRPLPSHDICAKRFPEESAIYVNIFSSKVDSFINVIDKFIDKEKYVEKTLYQGYNKVESFIHDIIKEENLNLYYATYDSCELDKCSLPISTFQIFTKDSCFLFSPVVLYNSNEDNDYFLFFKYETDYKKCSFLKVVMDDGEEFLFNSDSPTILKYIGKEKDILNGEHVRIYNQDKELIKEYSLQELCDLCKKTKREIIFSKEESKNNFISKFNLKKKNESEIIIINAYADTEEKMEILKTSISQLKKSHIDILLVSHYPVNYDIQNMVDYFLYDERNELFEKNKADLYWYENEKVYFQTRKKGIGRQSFAVLRSIQNAVFFSQKIGKKLFYHFDYDCLIDDKDIEVLKDLKLELIEKGKNGYFQLCDQGSKGLENSSFIINFFACYIDTFIEKYGFMKTIEEYKSKIDQYMLEFYMYERVKNCLSDFIIDEGNGTYDLKRFSNSKSNICTAASNSSSIDIALENKSNKLYLFIVCEIEKENYIINYIYKNENKIEKISLTKMCCYYKEAEGVIKIIVYNENNDILFESENLEENNKIVFVDGYISFK